MTRGRFRTDAAWSAAGTLLPAVLGVVAIPVLLHNLAPAGFAAFALCLALISFSPALDFGVARTAMRRVAALHGDNLAQRGALASACIRRAAWAGLATASLLALALPLVGATVLDSPAAGSRVALYLAVACVPLAIVANTQRAVLEGARMFAASASVRIALGLLTAIVPAALSWWTQRIDVLCASLVLLRLAAALHQARTLRQAGLHGDGSYGHGSVNGSGNGGAHFWQESAWYAVLAPVALLMSGFDRFLLAWIGGLDTTGLATFLAPQEMALRALLLSAALIPALLVRLAATATSDADAQALSARLFRHVVPAMAIACLAVSGLAPALAPHLFAGVDAAQVTEIVQVLAIGVFSNALAQFPMATLTARGHVRDAALMHAVQLPLFLAALGPLIAALGAVGAAWAWSGRIVLDTLMLCWQAGRRLPALRIPLAQPAHAAGVLLLALLGAAT